MAKFKLPMWSHQVTELGGDVTINTQELDRAGSSASFPKMFPVFFIIVLLNRSTTDKHFACAPVYCVSETIEDNKHLPFVVRPKVQVRKVF